MYLINPTGAAQGEDAFGQRFFRTHFMDYVRQHCVVDAEADRTPILELRLSSGEKLDISHIVELHPQMMIVDVFDLQADRSCRYTHRAYVRYATIFRIDVRDEPREVRPLGFHASPEPAVKHAPVASIAAQGGSDTEA